MDVVLDEGEIAEVLGGEWHENVVVAVEIFVEARRQGPELEAGEPREFCEVVVQGLVDICEPRRENLVIFELLAQKRAPLGDALDGLEVLRRGLEVRLPCLLTGFVLE